MVAVSVTLAPKAAVVIAVAGADVSAAFRVVVVAALVTEKLVRGVAVLLVVKLFEFDGVKVAVRDSAPTGNVVLARVAAPEVTLTAAPSATLLL
jgi:hypothetical protein